MTPTFPASPKFISLQTDILQFQEKGNGQGLIDGTKNASKNAQM
jgi:hypothetical protein